MEIAEKDTSKLLKSLEKDGVSNPCEWDINNGSCEEWATAFCEQVEGAVAIWLDFEEGETIRHLQKTNSCLADFDPSLDYGHCVVLYEDQLYDSQHPDGVHSWHELDFVKGLTRNEFLELKRIESKTKEMKNA